MRNTSIIVIAEQSHRVILRQRRPIPLLLALLLLVVVGPLALSGCTTPTHTTQSASPSPVHTALVPSPVQQTDKQSVTPVLQQSNQKSTAHSPLPRPDHIVIVIEENHASSSIIGAPEAPYINGLAKAGALFVNSFAISHPSEPNYLALFSGSTQDIADDSCPHSFSTPDLGGNLLKAGLSFVGYSESMGSAGYTGCQYPLSTPTYARKHNPWVNFSDVPANANQPLTSFPADYRTLPTISIIVPNLLNDMHDGSIQQGDAWLQQHIESYVQWASTHNSLLLVTWDEDDGTTTNQIPTVLVGPMVKAGTYHETITHYSVLRTLEDMYQLPRIGQSASAQAILDCWEQ